MAKDDIGGVWRTIGGRRVFIKDGEDLSTAMKNSGKFKNTKTSKGKSEKKEEKKEITEQGKSNRKEVSQKIQDHILEYYEDDDNAEEAFVSQMEAMKDARHTTAWSWGQELANGGSYLVYTDDMREFLDGLKINPKGKSFSDDKVFKTYTSLVGRESAKLYEKLKNKK